MWTATIPLFGRVFDVIDQLVEDKDLKLQLTKEMRELEISSMETLIKTSTTPWVDALVKLMYASVALIRPLTSVGIFLFGLIFPEKLSALYAIDQTLGTVAGAAVFGSAPAWGISRHLEKKKKSVTKSTSTSTGHPPEFD
jgi:hypothetical protein